MTHTPSPDHRPTPAARKAKQLPPILEPTPAKPESPKKQRGALERLWRAIRRKNSDQAKLDGVLVLIGAGTLALTSLSAAGLV